MFTVPNNLLERRRRRLGLTLLEVVVGLAILALMAGAIYGIVMGSVEATATLSRQQTEDRRLETFLDRTRVALAHLPGGATLELKIIESEPLRQELTLRGVNEAYVWGEHGGWDKPAVTLAPQRWPDDRQPLEKSAKTDLNRAPRFSLAMSSPDFYREQPSGEPAMESPLRSRQGHQLVQPDTQGRFWLELLPEVERVEWRFYDPAKKIWVEQQGAGRPPLVELRLKLPGHKHPLRVVFETS